MMTSKLLNLESLHLPHGFIIDGNISKNRSKITMIYNALIKTFEKNLEDYTAQTIWESYAKWAVDYYYYSFNHEIPPGMTMYSTGEELSRRGGSPRVKDIDFDIFFFDHPQKNATVGYVQESGNTYHKALLDFPFIEDFSYVSDDSNSSHKNNSEQKDTWTTVRDSCGGLYSSLDTEFSRENPFIDDFINAAFGEVNGILLGSYHDIEEGGTIYEFPSHPLRNGIMEALERNKEQALLQLNLSMLSESPLRNGNRRESVYAFLFALDETGEWIQETRNFAVKALPEISDQNLFSRSLSDVLKNNLHVDKEILETNYAYFTEKIRRKDLNYRKR